MIYFLKCEYNTNELKAGDIKIGTTIRLSSRLNQISVELGHVPTLLGVLDGGFAEERALHQRYKGHRRYGEWFNPEDSNLIELIEAEAREWDGEDEVPLSALGVPVKVDAEVIAEAKMVAASRDVTLAEYISELLRPLVRRDLEQETTRRIHPKAPKGKGGPKA